MKLLYASAISVLLMGTAHADSCAANFITEGVPLLTGISYRTSQTFAGLKPEIALSNLAKAVAAEGFEGIRIDKATSSVSAHQEMSGSGRKQTLRVVTRKSGNGTLVNAVFTIQAGQMADSGTVRTHLCRVIAGAN